MECKSAAPRDHDSPTSKGWDVIGTAYRLSTSWERILQWVWLFSVRQSSGADRVTSSILEAFLCTGVKPKCSIVRCLRLQGLCEMAMLRSDLKTVEATVLLTELVATLRRLMWPKSWAAIQDVLCVTHQPPIDNGMRSHTGCRAKEGKSMRAPRDSFHSLTNRRSNFYIVTQTSISSQWNVGQTVLARNANNSLILSQSCERLTIESLDTSGRNMNARSSRDRGSRSLPRWQEATSACVRLSNELFE